MPFRKLEADDGALSSTEEEIVMSEKRELRGERKSKFETYIGE